MAINVLTASGNIGRDCEVRWTKNGKGIAQFSLPVKSGYGEHEKTSWVTCKLFGAKAEGQLPQYLTKGTKVTVTGAFVLEQWEKDGVQHSMPVILVNDVDFGSNPTSANKATIPPAKNQGQSFQPPAVSDDDLSEDIPF